VSGGKRAFLICAAVGQLDAINSACSPLPRGYQARSPLTRKDSSNEVVQFPIDDDLAGVDGAEV
jgi:hypothetical protein